MKPRAEKPRAEVIAIIPARGGSRRIPHKNVRSFNGVPMIARSIAAARDSGLFDRILVSTDSQQIAEVALAHGAECPFRRPPALADDHTGTAPVLEHALRWAGGAGIAIEFACCLYATAPFVQAEDLAAGLECIAAHRCGSTFAVTSFGFPIQRALRIDEAGTLSMFWPEHRATRSQDLAPAYHDAGQFYWVDVARFMREPTLYCDDSRPIVLPRWRVQDIDSPEDWTRAELLHEILMRKELIR